MHQHIANATFQVIAGDSSGSGFSFIREDLVVTNYHVIESCFNLETRSQTHSIILKTEANEQIAAGIVYFDHGNDFVIMKLLSALPTGRVVLQPSVGFSPTRGKKIIFAGYPHGIPQLLTNEAIISAPMDAGRFALDGMVNGGNSGGPIIDRETGEAIGIVTQRRYVLPPDAQQLSNEVAQLRGYLAQAAQQMSVEVMGVNFGQMADMFSRSLQMVNQMMNLNANPGIGTGFSLEPIVNVVSSLPQN